MRKQLRFFLFLSLMSIPAAAQTTGPVRDPNALALASKALQSLAGGTAITDITMEGSATYIAGTDQEMGPVTLVALGNQQSRVTLNLTSGQRLEIRSGTRGVWSGADGVPHVTASSNSFVNAAWFYPALSLAALGRDPTLVATLVGQEVHEGAPVYHLLLQRALPSGTSGTASLIQRFSTMQLYLDATNLRPVALDFNIHPDRNMSTEIPVEIQYGAYQTSNGVWVPTHIQKYLQNSLVLDLTLANAAVNTGVSAGLFSLPNLSTGGAQ